MFLKRLVTLILVPAIILSGCADRFKGMSTPAGECGYRQVHFDEFASCMRGKFNPENLGAAKEADQYDVKKSPQTDVLDDIRSEFITGLDNILEKYQGKKGSQRSRDKAAYDSFDQLTRQCAAKEEAANKQAQTFAAILLAGAAIGGAAAYCSHHNCGGGGGGSNYSSCCKVCTIGKACGNTCIHRSYICHQPVGCACDG